MKKLIVLVTTVITVGAVAQTTKTTTTKQTITSSTGETGEVIEETIEITDEQDSETVVVHTKTILFNGQSVVVPYELSNTDALDLVSGNKQVIVYSEKQIDSTVTFEEQFTEPWKKKVLEVTKLYTVSKDAYGYFVALPEQEVSAYYETDWKFIGIMITCIVVINFFEFSGFGLYLATLLLAVLSQVSITTKDISINTPNLLWLILAIVVSSLIVVIQKKRTTTIPASTA